MNLADILTLAGLSQQEPTNSLSTPGSSCNQHMNPNDMRTLIVKLEQPQQEQEMVATEEAEGSYANVPDEREVGDTHDDFSFKGFGKRKRHTHDALGNYGDNPLEESNMFEMYKNFKLNEVNWKSTGDVEAEYKRLGLDQGDDPLGGWYDTMGMSDMEIRHKRTKRIQQAYKDNALAKAQAQTSRQQDAQVAARGSEGEKAGRAVAVRTANKAAELAQQHAGEEEAAIALADPTSASAITQDKQAQDNRANTTIARANAQPTTQVAKQKSVVQKPVVQKPAVQKSVVQKPVIPQDHEGEAAGRIAGLEAERLRNAKRKQLGGDLYKSPLRKRADAKIKAAQTAKLKPQTGLSGAHPRDEKNPFRGK